MMTEMIDILAELDCFVFFSVSTVQLVVVWGSPTSSVGEM